MFYDGIFHITIQNCKTEAIVNIDRGIPVLMGYYNAVSETSSPEYEILKKEGKNLGLYIEELLPDFIAMIPQFVSMDKSIEELEPHDIISIVTTYLNMEEANIDEELLYSNGSEVILKEDDSILNEPNIKNDNLRLKAIKELNDEDITIEIIESIEKENLKKNNLFNVDNNNDDMIL